MIAPFLYEKINNRLLQEPMPPAIIRGNTVDTVGRIRLVDLSYFLEYVLSAVLTVYKFCQHLPE